MLQEVLSLGGNWYLSVPLPAGSVLGSLPGEVMHSDTADPAQRVYLGILGGGLLGHYLIPAPRPSSQGPAPQALSSCPGFIIVLEIQHTSGGGGEISVNS